MDGRDIIKKINANTRKKNLKKNRRFQLFNVSVLFVVVVIISLISFLVLGVWAGYEINELLSIFQSQGV